MQDNITEGSAVSSGFVIHFEQPALHFHVVHNQLAESTDQLWSTQPHKELLYCDNVNWSLLSTPCSQTFGNVFPNYGFCFLELLRLLLFQILSKSWILWLRVYGLHAVLSPLGQSTCQQQSTSCSSWREVFCREICLSRLFCHIRTSRNVSGRA